MAEQAEMFDDMLSFICQVLSSKGITVNVDERNLASVAFKNLISNKRSAIRTIAAIEANQKFSQFANALQAYKDRIVQKFIEDCEDIIAIIQTNVLSNADEECEAKLFFVKIISDFYRYIAEVAQGETLENAKQQA